MAVDCTGNQPMTDLYRQHVSG